MRVGICLIATGKYDMFLNQLITSLDKHFFKGQIIDVYLFSDKHHNDKYSDRVKIIQTKIDHKPFPYATLYRYKYFDTHKDVFVSDYLFYLDVDMRLVADVGEEILGDIVCVQHPGFYAGGWGSTNCDRRSLAYLPQDKWVGYKAGGFQGGSRRKYLTICEVLAWRISEDEKKGVMAEWHDETHWNWCLKTQELFNPEIKILSPAYCYPETASLPFDKKILALNKDHAFVRS